MAISTFAIAVPTSGAGASTDISTAVNITKTFFFSGAVDDEVDLQLSPNGTTFATVAHLSAASGVYSTAVQASFVRLVRTRGSAGTCVMAGDAMSAAATADIQNATTGQITPLRDVVVGQRCRIFGDSFADGIGVGEDAGVFPNPTVTGSGSFTATAGSGQLSLRTGATAGSSVIQQSNLINTFRTGYTSGYQSGIQAPATPTALRVVSRIGGVDTQVQSTAFSVVPNYALDGNFHQWTVVYQGSAAIFAADGVALHRMSGQTASPRTGTLDLPIRHELVNASGVTTVRWGVFSATDGYFVEATYATNDVTMNVRGSTAIIIGSDSLDVGVIGTTTPLRASLVAGTDGVNLQPSLINVASFMASTNGSLASGTVIGTVTSLAYLFHSASSTKRIEIKRIDVTAAGGISAGGTLLTLALRGAFITAENATPGGTSQTINGTDRSQTPDATDVFRTGATGAPTRLPGDVLSTAFGASGSYVWCPDTSSRPIVLRPGVAEGFEIRIVVGGITLTTAAQFAVTFYWTER
jgi:hypothetical protein